MLRLLGKKKYSIDNAHHLCAELRRLEGAGTADDLVEALREMVEVVVWGDKHMEEIFDIFMENQIMNYFQATFQENTAPRVLVQIIQCLTILLQNLTREQSVFFVCSNNYINSIIAFNFDRGNEEILSNYVSFLKSLSLRLNNQAAQFFFNGKSFPLYEEAASLFDHDDRMVRTAARSIVVNVLQLSDDSIAAYLERSMDSLFSTLCGFLTLEIRTIDAKLKQMDDFKKCDPGDVVSASLLETLLEDLVDDFYYINDLADLPQKTIRQKLVHAVRVALVDHLLVDSLVRAAEPYIDQTDTRVSTHLVLYIFAAWIRVNTVPEVHACMVAPLLRGERESGSPLAASSVSSLETTSGVAPTVHDGGGPSTSASTSRPCGALVELLKCPRLRTHVPAAAVAHALLGNKLLAEADRDILLGSPDTHPHDDAPAVDDPQAPYPSFSYPLSPDIALELYSKTIETVEGESTGANGSSPPDELDEVPSSLADMGPTADRWATVVERCPFAAAVATSVLLHLRYKEVCRFSCFKSLIDSLHVFAQRLPPADLCAIVTSLCEAAKLNIVRRVSVFSEHIDMLREGSGGGSPVTPSSILSRLLDRQDVARELLTAHEAIYVRLQCEFEQSSRAASRHDDYTRASRNVRYLYPLTPALDTWVPEVANVCVDGDIRTAIECPEKYAAFQALLQGPSGTVNDRVSRDEAELEYVEAMMFLTLRSVLYRRFFGNADDPLAERLRAMADSGTIDGVSVGSPGEVVSMAATSRSYGQGIRCECVQNYSEDSVCVPCGRVLYVFPSPRALIVVDPDDPIDPLSGAGIVIAVFQTFFTDAVVSTSQPFRLALSFETLTKSTRLPLAFRDRLTAKKVALLVKKLALGARTAGSSLTKTILASPTTAMPAE